MIRIYNILFTIIFPFLFCIKKIRTGMREKFGFYDFDFSKEENILWIHAISVGELGLVEDIIKKNSNYKIVLTTSTPQGQELAKKKYSEYCKKITYFPYDFKFSIKTMKSFKIFSINSLPMSVAPSETIKIISPLFKL